MARSKRAPFAELAAFAAVAEEESFTRAAAKLGLSTPALTRTIQALEARLGVHLFERSTRSVALTSAGRRLRGLGARIDALERELAGLAEASGAPTGRVRIATADSNAAAFLWPALAPTLARYSGIELQLIAGDTSENVDGAVVAGAPIERNMGSVRIGPDRHMALIAAPTYLAARPSPKTPHDLADHECIACAEAAPWAFERGGKRVEVRPTGRFAFDDAAMSVRAALNGFGLAYVTEDQVAHHIGAGRLVRLLPDWCVALPAYHLRYPTDRQPTPAMAALIQGMQQERGARAPQPSGRLLFLPKVGTIRPGRAETPAFAND